MALTSFTELKSAIENWLNETGNQAVIDNAADFITLAESWMKDNVEFRPRYLETRQTLTANAETLALPTGFLEIIQARLNTDPRTILRFTTQSDMDNYATTGKPIKCVIEGSNLRFAPIPDQSYELSILFSKFPTALSSSNSSNTILENQPNIYLWASLLQAAIYLKDDAQILKFSNLLESSIKNRYQSDIRSKYSSPIQLVNQYLT